MPQAFIRDIDCQTPFGDAEMSRRALVEGRSALRAVPLFDYGTVPLALMAGRALDETVIPSWQPPAEAWKERLGADKWGVPARPVIVTSSNFGVGSQFAYRWGGNDRRHLGHGAPSRCLEYLRACMGWGDNVLGISHACVSANLGLLHAARLIESGTAEEALVFSFDLLSPFVAGGFASLKILNAGFPSPYTRQEMGSVGLGDGLAFAVLGRTGDRGRLSGFAVHNEMHHPTGNRADGGGFDAVLSQCADALRGRRIWVKGHGTGTVEAGRLETEAVGRHFAGGPLVGWKGGLGHTLGSCALVELAIAVLACETGEAPGTVGAVGESMSPQVARTPFATGGFDGVLCAANAFGGAHAGVFYLHD